MRALAGTVAGATSRSLVVVLPKSQSFVHSPKCDFTFSVVTTTPISASSPRTRKTSPGVMRDPIVSPDRAPAMRS